MRLQHAHADINDAVSHPGDFHQSGAIGSAILLQERQHLLRSLFVVVLDRQCRFDLSHVLAAGSNCRHRVISTLAIPAGTTQLNQVRSNNSMVIACRNGVRRGFHGTAWMPGVIYHKVCSDNCVMIYSRH